MQVNLAKFIWVFLKVLNSWNIMYESDFCVLWLKTPSLKFREHHLFISRFYNHFSDIVSREQSQKCFGHFFKTFHNSLLGFDFSFIYPLCHLSNAFVPTVCPSWNNEAFQFKLLKLKSVKVQKFLKANICKKTNLPIFIWLYLVSL